MSRKQGILCPVFSLPGKYGIGTFGKAAYDFVDFCVSAGSSYWQILPLGPTCFGDSPYQSYSTFAGSINYIALETLIENGYLKKADCDKAFGDACADKVDYELLKREKTALLDKAVNAAVNAGILSSEAFRTFCEENADWINDYALFMSLKEHFKDVPFIEWPKDIRTHGREAVLKYEKELEKQIVFHKVTQFWFLSQWEALKKYANDKGLKIIGDIPIYVAFDSADTWANRDIFLFDENDTPIAIAGCPPDAFSKTGQLWGNPLYNWDRIRETGYNWWIRRFGHCFKMFDALRIDHFRGFDEYWSVPYGDETAMNGHWEKGPGIDFFNVIKGWFGPKEIIAEDLGFITDSVRDLLKNTGFPGMKVMQFAFSPDSDSAYLPHNHIENCVVYTGTHDNETTFGWASDSKASDRKYACEYLGCDEKSLADAVIRSALMGPAFLTVIPIQDYLKLGNEARINAPGTVGLNWKWRMKSQSCSKKLSESIRRMNAMYRRL